MASELQELAKWAIDNNNYSAAKLIIDSIKAVEQVLSSQRDISIRENQAESFRKSPIGQRLEEQIKSKGAKSTWNHATDLKK